MKPGNRWGWNKGNFANEQKGGRIVPPFLLYLVNRQNKPVFLILSFKTYSPITFVFYLKIRAVTGQKWGILYILLNGRNAVKVVQ